MIITQKKTYFGEYFMPNQHSSHSNMSDLSMDPLVSGSTGVAGAESRAIGISLWLVGFITSGLTTHLLFTFTLECGGRRGFHRSSSKSRRWQTWKWASLAPITERMRENVSNHSWVWLLAKIIFMLVHQRATLLLRSLPNIVSCYEGTDLLMSEHKLSNYQNCKKVWDVANIFVVMSAVQRIEASCVFFSWF